MNPDQQTLTKPIRLIGEPLSSEQLAWIIQIVTHCGLLSCAESGPVQGLVKDFKPVSLRVVSTKQKRKLFREAIERAHDLGYRIPFLAPTCVIRSKWHAPHQPW